MRWGASTEEKKAREDAWRQRLTAPHAWFAWRPVRFRTDERWVWLETVARRAEGFNPGDWYGTTAYYMYRPWEDHVRAQFERGISR